MKRTAATSLIVALAMVGATYPAIAQQYPPTTPQGPVVVNPSTQKAPQQETITQTSPSRPPLGEVVVPLLTNDPYRFNVELGRTQVGNTVIIYVWTPFASLILEEPDALVTMQSAKGQRLRVGTAKVRPDGTVRLPVLSFRKAGTYQIQIQDKKAKRSNWFNVKAEKSKKVKKKK